MSEFEKPLALPSSPSPQPIPIPMEMFCPACGRQHVDEGEWQTRPHKTHQCQFCGEEWRMRMYHTVGVPPEIRESVPSTPSPTYEYLLEVMRDYAKAQQKCGNPARLEDLREFRRWKNMPQDKAHDAALIAELGVPSTPSPTCPKCHSGTGDLYGCTDPFHNLGVPSTPVETSEKEEL